MEEPEIMIRKNAWRDFTPGQVFDCVEKGLFILQTCVPEEDGEGNRLTLHRMDPNLEIVWRVMQS
ncbi:hypothetical protein LCGC14_2786210 [marine sediment metagenome]|uniref:Uncharacterized protein n=1 Tax=marine sediment metagenome TaxID=412755 RepID=A0A0F9BID5_9ZZZZ